ncbi:cation acetate symporter [Desulfuromonas carbonis]|uniref:VC_2705 family sodium/solute symporter n=1 Tax=Desulfuromonas sp. DDH964 TaxID=1823759 RepID=UPI00078DA101|nr:VC_2705 family sodium/solute symporter [Desulfuromonas sp. DDH964]AMV71324.1 sodium/solute symporter family protein [Desulfuromonas sp. DDH964]
MSTEAFKATPALLLVLALVIFLLVGLFGSLRRQTGSSYYGIGVRSIGRIGIGAAIASNWMSAASFLGIAGIFYLKGYFAFAYVVGWTGGYVLLLILMAGQIRRFGKYTAPEFVGARYDSPLARLIAAVVAILISLIYCIAQYKGIGLVFSWIFGLDYTHSLLLGTLVVISYLVLSGILGAARNQRFQYAVLILSFLIPLMLIARKLGYNWLLPQFSYGEALQDLAATPARMETAPWAHGTPYQWLALCITLMVGTAGLPHVLSRFYTVPNVRDARWSVVWGLCFIGLLYWSAPAYATFAHLWEARNGTPPLPPDMADLVVIKAGEWAGVPIWAVGIIAVGAISAAFSTVSGLLITGAGAFSYDIYCRFLNPQATEQERMQIAKGATLVLAALVLLVAAQPLGLIAEVTAVAFALAGNTLFPVFLLGIWWDRANKQGAIAGMLTGIVITFGAMLLPTGSLLGTLFPATSSAFLGAPLVILVMIATSLATPQPPEEIRRFLAEEVHSP